MGTSLGESMEVAATLARSGNDTGAIEAYLSILEIDAENATAWYCLGVLYTRVNSLDKAVEAFEKSDMIMPNHPATVANLAYLLAERDPLAASKYARSAIVTISDDDGLSSIADYSEPTEQKRVFIEARQIEDENGQNEINSAYQNFESIPDSYEEARTLTTDGDHSGAVALWKGLLEESPNTPEVWRGLGGALRSAGYEDRANQCFKKAEAIELSLIHI